MAYKVPIVTLERILAHLVEVEDYIKKSAVVMEQCPSTIRAGSLRTENQALIDILKEDFYIT